MCKENQTQENKSFFINGDEMDFISIEKGLSESEFLVRYRNIISGKEGEITINLSLIIRLLTNMIGVNTKNKTLYLLENFDVIVDRLVSKSLKTLTKLSNAAEAGAKAAVKSYNKND